MRPDVPSVHPTLVGGIGSGQRSRISLNLKADAPYYRAMGWLAHLWSDGFEPLD
jgi:hypothetical protein